MKPIFKIQKQSKKNFMAVLRKMLKTPTKQNTRKRTNTRKS
uniref:Uncharacterized protein n=1 Tax=viral metagenome TaxID=1070528 RepID=A0A6C0JLA9_9ZZZZ